MTPCVCGPFRLVRAGASPVRGSGADGPPRWMMAVSCWLWVAPLQCACSDWGADRGQAGRIRISSSLLRRWVRCSGNPRDAATRSTPAGPGSRMSHADMLRRYRIRLADGSEERAAAIHTATVNERTRIARDIHDNVGHLLTRAIMQAEAGRLVGRGRRRARCRPGGSRRSTIRRTRR